MTSGFISDLVFKIATKRDHLIYGLTMVVGLAVFIFAPGVNEPGGHFLLFGKYGVWQLLGACCFGFGLGGLLVFVAGLTAMDICSKKASGAALGLIGMLSYGGAAVQDLVSGNLIEAGKMKRLTARSPRFTAAPVMDRRSHHIGHAVCSSGTSTVRLTRLKVLP